MWLPKRSAPNQRRIYSFALRATAETSNERKSGRSIAAFLAWLSENEAYISDKATWGRAAHPLVVAEETRIEDEPAGRGLLARRDIQAGETIFQVPQHLCFTKDVAVRRFAALGVPEMANEEEYLALAALLVYERGLVQSRRAGTDSLTSFWEPYLDILPPAPWEIDALQESGAQPPEILNALWLWADDDLEWLLGSPTLAAARRLRAKVESEYHEACKRLYRHYPDVFNLEDAFRLNNFLWAFGILFSRAVSLPAEDGLLALVPYADLANHSPFCTSFIDSRMAEFPYSFRAAPTRKGNEWWRRLLDRSSSLPAEKNAADSSLYRNGSQREIIAYADRFYDKFEQVYVSYGQKSNAELLLLYGFVSDRNPYNSVEVVVSMDSSSSQSDSLVERKRAYLRACGRDPDHPECFPLYADRYPVELMQFLRFAALTEDDMAGCSDLEQVDVTKPLNKANEVAARNLLITACESALDAYPTSIGDDEAALRDKSMTQLLTRKQRLSLRLRLGEKRILERTIAGVRREIQNLKL
jgi:histone-lysine N-methyltransferase SETD3